MKSNARVLFRRPARIHQLVRIEHKLRAQAATRPQGCTADADDCRDRIDCHSLRNLAADCTSAIVGIPQRPPPNAPLLHDWPGTGQHGGRPLGHQMATALPQTGRGEAAGSSKRPGHRLTGRNHHGLPTLGLRIAMRRPKALDWPAFQGQENEETAGQRSDLRFTLEPPSGFEPETYALRVVRSCFGGVHARPLKGLRRKSALSADVSVQRRTPPDRDLTETGTETREDNCASPATALRHLTPGHSLPDFLGLPTAAGGILARSAWSAQIRRTGIGDRRHGEAAG